MRKILPTLVYFCILLKYVGAAGAQKLSFFLLDAQTQQPVSYATIGDINRQDYTLSNEDGKVEFNVSPNTSKTLSISHINYYPLTLSIQAIQNNAKVLLQPISNQLEEVVVTNFNLKKKIEKVLDNYNHYYVDYPTLNEGTYKEINRVNGKLNRLILSEINWWTKSQKFRFFAEAISTMAVFCQVELKNTKMLINKPLTEQYITRGSVTTVKVLSGLYLNYVLNDALPYLDYSYVTVLSKNNGMVKLGFETEYQLRNKMDEDSIKLQGVMVFDSNFHQIIYIEIVHLFKNNETLTQLPTYTSIPENIPKQITKRLEKQTTILQYDKENSNEKLNLRLLKMVVEAELGLDEEILSIVAQNDIYITKTIREKKFRGKSINFYQPIFANIASNKKNQNSIPLTQEEERLIKEQEKAN